MSDDTGTSAGWMIVSVGDDGSVLCQSPAGHRRRYWFQATECDRLRVLADTQDRTIRQLGSDRAALVVENEELRALLTPCRPDTDAQTDPAYPATVNDVLHLLSAYIADFLPDDVELTDEYYASWERQARPVIERLLAEATESESARQVLETARTNLSNENEKLRAELRSWNIHGPWTENAVIRRPQDK